MKGKERLNVTSTPSSRDYGKVTSLQRTRGGEGNGKANEKNSRETKERRLMSPHMASCTSLPEVVG